MTWPEKYSIFGVEVSATRYGEAVDAVISAAAQRRRALVTALAVHGLIEAAGDASFLAVVNDFHLVAPDGHPVKAALNLLHGTSLPSRVAGPDLMLRICEGAAKAGIGIYLYGGGAPVVERLGWKLRLAVPGLRIAGQEASVFRRLTAEESSALADRINLSGAGIVFVGLGCPLQERFAHGMRFSVDAVQVCVGAAFDFHAGSVRRAPRWMQDHCLEWFYRLLQEPRRLWRRYAWTNSEFVVRLLQQMAGESISRLAKARAARK